MESTLAVLESFNRRDELCFLRKMRPLLLLWLLILLWQVLPLPGHYPPDFYILAYRPEWHLFPASMSAGQAAALQQMQLHHVLAELLILPPLLLPLLFALQRRIPAELQLAIDPAELRRAEALLLRRHARLDMLLLFILPLLPAALHLFLEGGPPAIATGFAAYLAFALAYAELLALTRLRGFSPAGICVCVLLFAWMFAMARIHLNVSVGRAVAAGGYLPAGNGMLRWEDVAALNLAEQLGLALLLYIALAIHNRRFFTLSR